VECCPTPLQGLCKVAAYWQELEHAEIHVYQKHPKHAQWVTRQYAGHGRTGIVELQELCTDPCDMGPSIIMLKHEMMAADEWQDNGPHDLVTVSLCIQIAFDKIQVGSLSVTYACPYHNHTANMGHSVHNVDISKPLAHTLPSALYS
jgi:hypothetical protein